MERKVRWGILSTANIGRKAVGPAIQASSNGEVVAVASRDAAQAAAYATALGIPRHHDSYEALLADDGIDAVYNPLPNSLHREWTIRALEAGKHVLCEKPLGLSAAECREMAAAAEGSGRFLMEAFMYRFHPRTVKAREMAAAGRLGDVRLVRATFGFTVSDPANIRLQPELGGGALMDVGCYCVDVARQVFGREPLEAQARAVWSGSGVDARLLGTLDFGGGAFLQFDCALDAVRVESVVIDGSQGRLRLDGAFVAGKGETTLVHEDRAAGTEVLSFAGVDQYQLMAEHFADCVLTGAQPLYGGGHAAGGMAALEALYASARGGGHPVQVSST